MRHRGATCRSRAKQRHTAGGLGSAMRISYPHHPRFGQIVVVLGAKQHAGVVHLVIRQPDGTLSLVPRWMTEAAASSCELRQAPRLSVERLSDLRCLVDALLASMRGESAPGEGGGDGSHETNPGRPVRSGEAAAAPGGAGEIGTSAEVAVGGGRLQPAASGGFGPRPEGGRR